MELARQRRRTRLPTGRWKDFFSNSSFTNSDASHRFVCVNKRETEGQTGILAGLKILLGGVLRQQCFKLSHRIEDSVRSHVLIVTLC